MNKDYYANDFDHPEYPGTEMTNLPNDFTDQLRTIAKTLDDHWSIAAIKVRGAANEIERLQALVDSECKRAEKAHGEVQYLTLQIEQFKNCCNQAEVFAENETIINRELRVTLVTIRDEIGPKHGEPRSAEVADTTLIKYSI